MAVLSRTIITLSYLVCSAVSEANLLSFVDGAVGNVLGGAFGLPGTNATFDYVVVGGGTAGLTIATRLASDPSISVAVIEAGGFYEIDNGNRSVVPAYSNFSMGTNPNDTHPLIDWGFVTEAQKGGHNREMHYARGKTLGGSSARNYMVYHCPTRGSMDKWAAEVGDDSYQWDNFFPYFKTSPDFTSFNRSLYNVTVLDEAAGTFDPQGGPLHVSYSNYADPFGSWAEKACTGLGMTLQNGLNAGILNGSSFTKLTIDPRNGYRSSSESSFLQAALQNGSSPTIYKNTCATKILFNGNKTATGVNVQTAGSFGASAVNFTISAHKEVS